MNTIKSCIPCVCTGSGHKRVCKEHNSRIKDVYHSIPLTEKSKEYCGILPYFGSPIYQYEVLLMGIACAPQIWMDYITLNLGALEHKANYG